MVAARAVLLALFVGSASALLLPTSRSPSQQHELTSRRAALQHGLAAAAALAAVPLSARADLGDLDAPEEAPVKMEAVQEEPFAQALVMTDKKVKKKERTPADRIKELEKKPDKTKKEIAELRQLKADEMCEMLGRGC